MAKRIKVKKPFYKRAWFIALAVFVLIGAVGSLGDDEISKPDESSKEVATAAAPSESEAGDPEKVAETPKGKEAVKEEPKEEPKEEAPVAEQKKEEKSTETVSQKNAVRSAKDYIAYTAFSKKGLVKQLEFGGFDNEDATYGAENCGADWMAQAIGSAKDYLEYTAFSKKGLVDQLSFGDFTDEEAAYGAENCGADWMQQAEASAKAYLEYSSFSKKALIEQLEFSGFTHEQAVHGVDTTGL